MAVAPPERPALPLPEPVQQLPVEWRVVRADDGTPLLALTPGDYQALSQNAAELLRWVTEAMSQLRYYRDDR